MHDAVHMMIRIYNKAIPIVAAATKKAPMAGATAPAPLKLFWSEKKNPNTTCCQTHIYATTQNTHKFK